MDVYGFIAQLTGRKSDGASTPEASPDSLNAEEMDDDERRILDWDGELAERSFIESPASMKTVLRFLSENADEWTPIEQMARVVYPASGDRQQFAGVLGAWGHRCSSRYGVTTWPFEVRDNHRIAMKEYRMERHFADLYRAVID